MCKESATADDVRAAMPHPVVGWRQHHHPSAAGSRNCPSATGEVDRTIGFELGMPPAHQHWTGTTWEPDPVILEDQALVVNGRGKGLVIVTGCGHAGAGVIVRDVATMAGTSRAWSVGLGFVPAVEARARIERYGPA